jgi:hypothetical protein
MSEVEKLKNIAMNTKLYSWERTKAVETLGEIGTKEAMMALLDIAGCDELYSWERDHALTLAREILRKTKE